MKKTALLMILVILGFITFAGTASALDLGTNITIWDGQGSGTGWNGAQEDNEVTNGCEVGQKWDLEGFYQKGYTLGMVAGFNFKTGEVGSGIRYNSGDIFIDVSNPLNAKYGTAAAGAHPINYGYEYVLDVDWNSNQYKIYDISQLTRALSLVSFSQNSVSNPFQYKPHFSNTGLQNDRAVLVSSGLIYTFGTLAQADNKDNLQGSGTNNTHYIATFDISFLETILGPDAEFLTHFTIGCGNDDLMGQGKTPSAPVPEPATLLLLGSGILGLAGFRRKGN
jgi:hypothetical protein